MRTSHGQDLRPAESVGSIFPLHRNGDPSFRVSPARLDVLERQMFCQCPLRPRPGNAKAKEAPSAGRNSSRTSTRTTHGAAGVNSPALGLGIKTQLDSFFVSQLAGDAKHEHARQVASCRPKPAISTLTPNPNSTHTANLVAAAAGRPGSLRVGLGYSWLSLS